MQTRRRRRPRSVKKTATLEKKTLKRACRKQKAMKAYQIQMDPTETKTYRIPKDPPRHNSAGPPPVISTPMKQGKWQGGHYSLKPKLPTENPRQISLHARSWFDVELAAAQDYHAPQLSPPMSRAGPPLKIATLHHQRCHRASPAKDSTSATRLLAKPQLSTNSSIVEHHDQQLPCHRRCHTGFAHRRTLAAVRG